MRGRDEKKVIKGMYMCVCVCVCDRKISDNHENGFLKLQLWILAITVGQF